LGFNFSTNIASLSKKPVLKNIKGKQKERLQRKDLNPLGALISDRSGKSFSNILQKCKIRLLGYSLSGRTMTTQKYQPPLFESTA
jgi:hypothetical protein